MWWLQSGKGLKSGLLEIGTFEGLLWHAGSGALVVPKEEEWGAKSVSVLGWRGGNP